jgi:hypothetical protein
VTVTGLGFLTEKQKIEKDLKKFPEKMKKVLKQY